MTATRAGRIAAIQRARIAAGIMVGSLPRDGALRQAWAARGARLDQTLTRFGR